MITWSFLGRAVYKYAVLSSVPNKINKEMGNHYNTVITKLQFGLKKYKLASQSTRYQQCLATAPEYQCINTMSKDGGRW